MHNEIFNLIHSTAIIGANVIIGTNVFIGPYSIIGDNVSIGDNTKIEAHVVISGPTTIGESNHFYQFGSIGAAPQDKKYADDLTTLVIGNNNTFRENVTINRGTTQDRGETFIGNNNWVMAGVHIAHDCIIGNHITLANATALAGHVVIKDWAILGGYTLVHQYCNIGDHSFCGMGSIISQDVPSFITVSGNPTKPRTINSEGLKRRGFDKTQISLIKKSYRILYRKNYIIKEAIQEIDSINDKQGSLNCLIDSLKNSARGIIR